MSLLSADQIPFWTAVAALGASVTALVTIVYTYFTARLVRSQAEPKVIVYAKHDSNRPSLLILVIENIGRDIARSVEFTSNRPIPSEAFGIERPTRQARTMTQGPFVVGIPFLGPGDSRVITWGQYGGLKAAIGPDPIEIQYTYKHGRRTLRGSATLEVASFTNIDASSPPALESARALKEIAISVKQIAGDIRREVSRDRSRDADDSAA